MVTELSIFLWSAAWLAGQCERITSSTEVQDLHMTERWSGVCANHAYRQLLCCVAVPLWLLSSNGMTGWPVATVIICHGFTGDGFTGAPRTHANVQCSSNPVLRTSWPPVLLLRTTLTGRLSTSHHQRAGVDQQRLDIEEKLKHAPEAIIQYTSQPHATISTQQ
jgi:hypothetical protein